MALISGLSGLEKDQKLLGSKLFLQAGYRALAWKNMGKPWKTMATAGMTANLEGNLAIRQY
jgi:hypothetical protein